MVPMKSRRRLPQLTLSWARVVTLLERRRPFQLAVLVTVAMVIGALTARLIATAKAERERWAGVHDVVMTTRAIESGTVISAGAVRRARLPDALTPDDALAALPTDARLALDVEAHTILTAALLAKDMAVVPATWRTVAIPDDVVTPPLAVGQRVDVVGGGDTLADGAIVATLDPLTVAVDNAAAAQVAAAARLGEVSLVAGG